LYYRNTCSDCFRYRSIIGPRKKKSKPNFNNTEILIVTFVLYSFTRTLFSSSFSTSTVTNIIFFATLYYGGRKSSSAINPNALLHISSTTLLIYIITFLYSCVYSNQPWTHFFIPNISVFGMLLASQLIFILPLYYFKLSRSKRISGLNFFLGTIIFGSFLLLITT